MALTRKFLAALGIEENKIDEIITAHAEVKDELKNELESYKEKAKKFDEVQKELNLANERIKELESDSDDSWKQKFESAVADKKKAEKELKEYKDGIAEKEKTQKKVSAFRNLLKDIGVSEKRIDAIIKVSDMKNVELEEDGKIKDSDTLKETLKNEWSDFIAKEGKQGAKTPTPPESGKGSSSSASFASQYAKEFFENKYGKLKED